MDSMFMDQHFLRSPLRLYSDVDMENNNLFSAAIADKARAQLLWGRPASYPPAASDLHALLGTTSPQLYTLNTSRGTPCPLPLPAHLWSQWTTMHGLGQIPNLLATTGAVPPSAHSQLAPSTSAAAAAAAAAVGGSGGGGAPELRLPRPIFPGMNLHRYSPYLVPKQLSPTALSSATTPTESIATNRN